MTTVRFYESVEDTELKFAVIVSVYRGHPVFCKHKDRNTYEIPGGHREPGETIRQAAERELQEETGATEYRIEQVCAYSVTGKTRVVAEENTEIFGMLYYAEIETMSSLHSEIEKLWIADTLPDEWTYPEIQPLMIEEMLRRGILPSGFKEKSRNCDK